MYKRIFFIAVMMSQALFSCDFGIGEFYYGGDQEYCSERDRNEEEQDPEVEVIVDILNKIALQEALRDVSQEYRQHRLAQQQSDCVMH